MIKGIPTIETPSSVMLKIAEAVKTRRLELNLTQSALAKRSDMSLSSYRRFETMGDISLKSLVQIAFALDATDDFLELFSKKQYTSIDDVVASSKVETRQRGSRNE
ncbi:helix-turn-helix domain-containing protein [Bacteroides propionicifaciens]|jgi:transcriptional regulator with XRE-family HTH domain|uniref:helix-turn-helix domain-containing protein n=1 Tax=Bacteroides propionicifaciens TaxID=392838 RepID=UPI000369AEA7|nr:helix-turn-helix transcriptional regulator [Bacteroides propionicifaciens]